MDSGQYGALIRTQQTIKAAIGVKAKPVKGSYLDATWQQYFGKLFVYVLLCLSTFLIPLLFFVIFGLFGIGFSLGLVALLAAEPVYRAFFLKWKFSKTVIEDKRLFSTITSLELWIKCLTWYGLGLVTFGVYALFWMPVRYQQYLAQNLHFEGEQNSQSEGDFAGGVWDYFLIRLASCVMLFMLPGLGAAWGRAMKQRFIFENRVIDGKRLLFFATGNSYFAMNVYWTVLTIITCGVWSLLARVCAVDRFETEMLAVEDPIYAE